jgi:hypothetical protein
MWYARPVLVLAIHSLYIPAKTASQSFSQIVASQMSLYLVYASYYSSFSYSPSI